MWLSLGFTVYLIEVRPHKGNWENKIEIYNEIAFLILSYFLFLLTDYNPKKSKTDIGWIMIGISAFNLIVPNLLILLWTVI